MSGGCCASESRTTASIRAGTTSSTRMKPGRDRITSGNYAGAEDRDTRKCIEPPSATVYSTGAQSRAKFTLKRQNQDRSLKVVGSSSSLVAMSRSSISATSFVNASS